MCTKKLYKGLKISLGLLLFSACSAFFAFFDCIIISLLVIGASYLLIIYFIDKLLEAHRKQYWQVPILYCALTLYLSMLFVVVMKISDVKINISDLPTTFDYLYFAVISMTSVGYGDVTATTEIGKKISIAMALLGSAHMLVSVTLFIDKLKK
tara:strand:- start:716 stop:1174 length:459 start_codon:yes stop_codon:yes gene_type:complete